MSAGILFKPLNGAHAVVETVFFFEFADRPFSDELVRGLLTDAYKAQLPTREETPSYEINFDMASEKTSQRISISYTFSTKREENSAPEWAVRINNGNQVSIHCTSYTRWDAVSSEAFKYLSELAKCAKTDLRLNSLGFKVVDRFEYIPDVGEYDLTKLLRSDSLYILPKAFAAGEKWHAHSGWFTPTAEDKKILNHLNIDSSALSFDHLAPKIYVSIDHTQARQREENEISALPAYSDVESFVSSARDFFKPLHIQNKLVVANLLTDDSSRRLNLIVEKE